MVEYRKKLTINGVEIPDPFDLKSGWVDEENGLTKWPFLVYTNIADFFKMKGPKFISDVEREYKLGKAYRYFECQFVREIFYNPISPKSKYCILRCRVVPSQRTSSKAYAVWVCVTKDFQDSPGGEIHAAYCTCTAGLSGTCNHVAGILFRIDNAVITGMTKPSQTSLPRAYNIPKGLKIDIDPEMASNMIFYTARYTSTTKRDFAKEKSEYLEFSTTLYDEHLAELSDKDSLRKKLYDRIKGAVPCSRFSELMEAKPLNRPDEVLVDLPKTLKETLHGYSYDENISLKQNVELFTNSLDISESDIENIKNATSDQNINTLWGHHREGRITASCFQKVYTRVNTLKKNPDADPSALIKTFTGKDKKDISHLDPVRHGKTLEPHALRSYTSIVKKTRKHKNVTVKPVGLAILKEFPFIGASPDFEITCSCCDEKGVGEIKCPFSVADQIPSSKNLDYLDDENNGNLKTNHTYYYQIQGQMAITNASFCDFFVYTKHGYHLERIEFDPAFWKKVLDNLTYFWYNYLCPVLITEKPLPQDILPFPKQTDEEPQVFEFEPLSPPRPKKKKTQPNEKKTKVKPKMTNPVESTSSTKDLLQNETKATPKKKEKLNQKLDLAKSGPQTPDSTIERKSPKNLVKPTARKRRAPNRLDL